MKLKVFDHEGKSYAELMDGKPVILEDDGKETPFDIAHTRQTIQRLNGESKGHREAREAAEARAKAFEGIEDPDAARKALETLKNIDQGHLIQAGKVEEIKTQAHRAAEERVAAAQKESGMKLKALEKERDGLREGWNTEKIGVAFSRSKFIADKVNIPPDMVQAAFGRSFKVEDGKVVAVDAAGKAIYSNARPGEIADFDEALETLVYQYPHKDHILKGNGNSGSGARQSAGGMNGKGMSRAEFSKLNPYEQNAARKEKGFQIYD